MSRGAIIFLVCLVLVFQVHSQGARPQLINHRVLPSSATVESSTYEYLLTTLEFDQDVYVNSPFVCAGQENDCVPSDCVPCDWSGENPTGCDNPRCCGPAQWPQFPSSNHTNEWCDSSLPPFTKLEYDQPSEVFSLGEGEYKYFRFFIGEEEYCRSIHIEVTTHYGDFALTTSSFVAYPSEVNINKIENGQQFQTSRMYRQRSDENFGQTVQLLCPNVNPAYERGTVAIALRGFHQSNVASVVVNLGEERYPIPPPANRISCADVPEDVPQEPPFTSDFYPFGGNVCIEEGVTSEIYIPRRRWMDVILPIKPGCQEISFITNGWTNTNTDPAGGPDQQIFMYCGYGSGSSLEGSTAASLITRFSVGVGTFYLSACFEEVTYLHCSALNIYPTGKTMMYWTTETTPIRHKISETAPGMLTTYYGRNQGGALFRELPYDGVGDWGNHGWSFITQSTTDPLVLYPPSARYTYNFTEDPIQPYLDAGFAEYKSNIVNIVDFTTERGAELRSRETLLENGFIYVMGITSATGMPVELCNDDDFNSGNCDRGAPLTDDLSLSWTEFMTTRTFSTMNVVTESDCNANFYYKQQDLVQKKVGEALPSPSLGVVAQAAYLSDLYNAGQTFTGCLGVMEEALSTQNDNVSKVEERYCGELPGTDEFINDPCCYFRAESIRCCAPTTIFVEEELFTGGDPDDNPKLSCQNPDCDESFFDDIAISLNSIGNPSTGCASGIQDPEYELGFLIEQAMQDFVRPCLVNSGYGDTFSGVECATQEDCAFLGSSCDTAQGRCRLQSAQDAREKYFECFYENMPPMVEDFIRTTVLNPLDANLPRDSDYFRYALRVAATKYDCLGLDPFDLTHGERWVADGALYCKAGGIGIPINEAEANEELINEICPEFDCLGRSACRWEIAKMCKTVNRVDCIDSYHRLDSASESSCPVDESVCSATSVTSSCNEGEYQCVVCLSDSDSCTVVEGVDTEEECARLVACEVPGGGIRYDLTEQECLDFGECSSLCDGESCRSVDDKKGACVAEGAADCGGIGGVEVDGECILDEIETSYACDQASIELSLTTQWFMCETMDITECSNTTNYTAPYKHLRCFVDIFRDCGNEDECLATGTCSDIEVAKKVTPDGSGWFTVSYGTCLTSGTKISFLLEEPICFNTLGGMPYKYGCYMPAASNETCEFWGSHPALQPYRTNFITPARTEEACRPPEETPGRFGCALPKDYEKTFWFYPREDCECLKGLPDYYFTWSPGSWGHGIPHSLTWTQTELRPKYTWEEAISLVEMESWVQDAVESFFIYAMKSQLVCEGNYVSSSLTTLVCDCVDSGENCYLADIETEVGVSAACAQTSSVLKGPSSHTTFGEYSINDLCTEATLMLIQRSWFLFPRSPPGVSFQFAEKKKEGVVQNSNGAEVGAVMGDGSRIIFTKPERVNHIYTCLLISANQNDYSDEYRRRDFGFPVDGYSAIRPMGLEDIIEKEEESLVYWCANVSAEMWSGDSVALFPISRMEDYEDEVNDSLSHRTKSLVYTLAACYIFDLLIISLFLIVMVKKHVLAGKSLPMITHFGTILAIVCIFRIAFCFIYVDDGFSELSEYVVFEIPTFLLFTGVILVLVLFMQLTKKNTFDFKSQDKSIWFVGLLALVVVWSLFIIVTVVYSEVILEEEDDSVCPGRVQADNSEIEDDTRTLSIVYQSIVIFLTLLFALAFAKYSLQLLSMSKNSGTQAKVFIFRLGTITVTSFVLRCILFLILLAADITSDIYLFITLFLTEVVMILLIGLELNKAFYLSLAGVVAETLGGSTLGARTGSSSTTPGSGTHSTQFDD